VAQDISGKDLPIKKVILYLAIVTGFTGAAFLSIDIGPFSLFPFRILLPLLWILFLLGILINEGKLSISHIRVKHYLLFLALWLVYSVLSLAWAADKVEAIRYNIFLFMGISVIFFVVFYLSNPKDLKRFYALWLILLVGLIGIGLWNHLTGQQLSVSGLADAPEPIRYNPTAVFYNQNDYATYLALSIPFVLAFVRYNRGLVKRLPAIAILILALYLLIVTFSRANYLAIIIGGFFWFLFLLRTGSKIKVLVLAGLIVLLILFTVPGWAENVVDTVSVQLSSLTSPATADSGLGSIDIRLNLLRNSSVFLVDSYGFGVGAGNAEYHMANFQVYDTEGILNPHNWWAEIAVNWGVFVLIGYTVFYLGILLKLYAIYGRLRGKSEKMICEALLVGLVVFFFASMSSSSIMAFAPQWLFFAFALGFLNYCRTKKVN
jgi:teichuronic acid biosynthesis protein TuaE